jgi:chaperonin GroEL
MAKIIKYWDEARKKIYMWVQKVANAVKVTMGPKWKNVILERSYWAPNVTNDWVTVAKDIELEDKVENIGAELVKEAATKTNDAAWDWTTTTAVLVDAIASEWLRYISSWVNPFALSRWLNKAVEYIVEELHKKSKKVTNKEEIKQVATISAQDEKVWELISEVMQDVWNDWVITVEEWKSIWLEKDVVKWMQFDQWYLSPYFVTDPNRMESVIEKPSIIITDKKISSIKDILPLLEQIASTWRKEIVIIADDIEGEALATLVLNRLRWVLNVLAVKAPWFWDRKKEILKDIAVVTGGQVISEEIWLSFENAKLDMLGTATKIIANKDKTTIVGWKWKQSEIDARVSQLRVQIDNTSSDYDREKLQERLARLAGWVAVIRVWAATEMEMKNKKYKIEDALNATKAAIEEWIVTWWWTALLKLVKELDKLNLEDKDEQVWVEIIKQAIQYPAKQIADNAWFKWDLVIEKVKENKDFNFWFNSKSGEYGDLLKDWVIDPVKVIRIALQEATSSASMVLTTDAVVTEAPKKDDGHNHAPDMWGMWWMGGMWMPWMM